MSWYYADAGRQIGPVEEAALDDLVRAGVVRNDTLVWREGMPNWQPHGAVRGPKPAPMPAVPISADSSFCSECGRPFAAAQLVAIGNANVCAQCKPIYLQRVREGGQAIGSYRYAGFWIRFVAYMIDVVILSVVQTIITVPIVLLGVGGSVASINSGSMAGMGALFAAYGVVILISLALTIGYEVYFLSTRGATLGKMALGLKVIRPDNSKISAGLALGRYLSKILSGMILYIGFFMAGWDDQKRALHDRICETRVIYAK